MGCVPARDYSNDVRLRHDHIVRENWTHEQVGEGGLTVEFGEGVGGRGPAGPEPPQAACAPRPPTSSQTRPSRPALGPTTHLPHTRPKLPKNMLKAPL